MKHCILSFLLVVTSVQASLKGLATEFLETNSVVLKNNLLKGTANLDYDALRATKTWSLTLSQSLVDSGLDTANAVIFEETRIDTLTADLTKSFEWGGMLSFENSLAREKITTPSLFSANTPEQNVFSQTLSYSQSLGKDFLGRTFRKELEIAQLRIRASEIEFDSSTEKLLFEFYNSYISARLNATLVILQEEALKRATRRQRTVARRVRDGLRDRVDLLQSNIQVKNAGETLKIDRQNLKQDLDQLSQHLHRAVKVEEIPVYDITKFVMPKEVSGDLKDNKSVKVLQERLKLSQEHLKKVNWSFWPKIALEASYQTNKFDEDSRGDAFSDGNVLSADRDQWGVALTLNVPLGYSAEKVNKAKANINVKTFAMEVMKTRLSLVESEKHLRERIKLYQQNIISAREKKDLADKVLSSTNRLYNLGRRDLDNVINAEETLITTEKSFVGYMFSLERLIASHAILSGNLEKVVFGE